MTQQSLVLALTCSLALTIMAPAAASQPSTIPVIKSTEKVALFHQIPWPGGGLAHIAVEGRHQHPLYRAFKRHIGRQPVVCLCETHITEQEN